MVETVATKYFLPKPAYIMDQFQWAAKISVHPEWCFRFTYKRTGEERVMMGFGSMNWQTYRSIQHYELQPDVKQKNARLGDLSPSFLNTLPHRFN